MSKTYAYECPACGEIFNISQVQKDNIQFDRLRCFECRYIFKASDHQISDDYYACNDEWVIHNGILHRGYLSQVEQLIRTPVTPLSRIFWACVCIFFLFLLLKQSSTFLLDRYAQNPAARPYLSVMCGLVSCNLPLRQNLYLLRQVDTEIQQGAIRPGSLLVSITLHNEADFAQPYPNLRITLSDEKHRIVGRRLYTVSEYLTHRDRLIPALSDVTINLDLVQPHERAVSIHVEIERI